MNSRLPLFFMAAAAVASICRRDASFLLTPREVCARIGLNWWVAVKLHETGWLSIDLQKSTGIEEGQDAELVFVASLGAGGCDEAMLKQMLAGLEKPYR